MISKKLLIWIYIFGLILSCVIGMNFVQEKKFKSEEQRAGKRKHKIKCEMNLVFDKELNREIEDEIQILKYKTFFKAQDGKNKPETRLPIKKPEILLILRYLIGSQSHWSFVITCKEIWNSFIDPNILDYDEEYKHDVANFFRYVQKQRFTDVSVVNEHINFYRTLRTFSKKYWDPFPFSLDKRHYHYDCIHKIFQGLNNVTFIIGVELPVWIILQNEVGERRAIAFETCDLSMFSGKEQFSNHAFPKRYQVSWGFRFPDKTSVITFQFESKFLRRVFIRTSKYTLLYHHKGDYLDIQRTIGQKYGGQVKLESPAVRDFNNIDDQDKWFIYSLEYLSGRSIYFTDRNFKGLYKMNNEMTFTWENAFNKKSDTDTPQADKPNNDDINRLLFN